MLKIELTPQAQSSKLCNLPRSADNFYDIIRKLGFPRAKRKNSKFSKPNDLHHDLWSITYGP